MAPINVLLSGLPSTPTICLRVGDHAQPLPQHVLIAAVTAATGLPAPSFYLRRAGTLLSTASYVTYAGQDTVFVDLFLRRALPGGKGGFGATLKGASASKKTTNFDACRDLQGRRIRHVRDEAVLAEYLRTQTQRSATNEERPRKRPRSPQPEAKAKTVDTDELDEAIDAVNRRVEDAVAAGLRTAAQRKRPKVTPPAASRAQAAPAPWVGVYDEVSSSDSEESAADTPVFSAQPSSRVSTDYS